VEEQLFRLRSTGGVLEHHVAHARLTRDTHGHRNVRVPDLGVLGGVRDWVEEAPSSEPALRGHWIVHWDRPAKYLVPEA
jgi:hypothetical protein